jgi:TonB family protein
MKYYRYPTVAAAFLFFLALAGGTVIHAQKKTTYYTNGNKQFRGKYELAWPEHERQDRDPNYGFPNKGESRYSNHNDLSRLLDLFPEIIYEGKCTFYHADGRKWYSGTFKHGFKNGRFQYWYASGRKKAEQYYQNGMANGLWKVWDTSGRLAASYSYKAIPEPILASLNSYMQLEMAGGHGRGTQDGFDSLYSSFADRKALSGMPVDLSAAHSDRLHTFKIFIQNNLLQHCVWDGPFRVWKKGKPWLEFAYEDNVPAGAWKIWEGDTLAFQMRFEHGKAISATEYIHTENNLKQKKMLEQHRKDSIRYVMSRDEGVPYTADESPNAIDPNMSTQQKTFRYVDQMPQYPGGSPALQRFVKSNVHYTEAARAHHIQGTVYVQFIVSSTGRIDSSSIKIQRGLGYGLDKEAVRVIKLMPLWKPGKRNGRSVDVYYTVPIGFRLE